MDFLTLIAAMLVVGLILRWAQVEQRKKEEEAAFRADLMMKAARAKTEAKETEALLTKGEVFVSKNEGLIILTDRKNAEYFNKEGELVRASVVTLKDFEQYLIENCTKIGDIA